MNIERGVPWSTTHYTCTGHNAAHVQHDTSSSNHFRSPTYGADNASVPDHVRVAEDVQQRHMLHESVCTLGTVLRHPFLILLALVRLRGEYSPALTLPLAVHIEAGRVRVHIVYRALQGHL